VNRGPNTRPPNLLIAIPNLSQGSATQAPSNSGLRNGGGCTLAVGPTRFFPDLFGLRGSEICRSVRLNSDVVLECSDAFLGKFVTEAVGVSSSNRQSDHIGGDRQD
jgi:hypothetical protein